MFGRFLSFLGFIPGLSGLSGFAGGYGSGTGADMDEDMDSGGEASISFTPGKPLASADAEETPDSKQARITDRDLVWAGKVETIQITNPEPIAYRFDLTVTDLNPAFYIRRPPVGGVPQREGGILLQPGEGASFEVVFVPPPAGEKRRTQTFGFVLTCFDPRRSGDPGEIVQDLPLRWVGLPTEGDLQITAVPPFVVTRPWRREARFAVRLANKSFLPPTIGMTILRAPTKDALERDAETVGGIQQALAARTPGVWQCLLPPPPRRGSYYATVRGAAQAAGSVSTPLALARPVRVRYVPWLRMGRDWALLVSTLLFLFWLVWGIPVHKTPVVRVSLNFGGLERGQAPPDSQLKDLNAQMILLDERGHDQEGQQPIPGVVIRDAYEFTGPPRWYGFRWPFGSSHWWNHWSREKQQFRVTVTPAESVKNAFRRYDLNALQADGNPSYDASASASPLGPLVLSATFTVPAVRGILVNIQLSHLGALAGRDLRRVTVRYTLDEQPQPPRTFELIHDTAGGLRPITLDLTDSVPLGGQRMFGVTVAADGLTTYAVDETLVKRRDKPLLIALAFPDAYPSAANTGGQPHRPSGAPDTPSQHPPQVAATMPPPVPAIAPPVTATTPRPPATAPHTVAPPHQTLTAGTPRQAHTLNTYRPPAATSSLPNVAPINVPPPPALPPPTPAGLVARPVSPSQIDVSWNSVPNSGLYLLYRSGGPGGEGTWPRSTHNTFYTDTGLVPGTIYHYRIQSKQGTRSSDLSSPTSALAPPVVTAPATVGLSVSAQGKDVHAVLTFANVSSQPVYLDKISACASGKIGDDVFQIRADGQMLPFTGRKSQRPADPGPRQFITLAPGKTVSEEVTLNHSYHLPSGTHDYTVTYSAQHAYPRVLQSLSLTSNEASTTVAR